jgi:UDP-4-amino-4,6-dideoxy-N-acetyl-beta-L-altrosamine transaminase
MIPYGRQSIAECDIDAVVEVLRSDWLTQGPFVERFERAVADYCGATHAVAVCNATAGLHLACRALGIGPGDQVWVSPNTFVASVNCARFCGAEVDFVDIDARTYNLSPAALEIKLAGADRTPKAVVVTHFAGQSCDMVAFSELAARYGFALIEDAAHALGGDYQGEPVGSCRYSDMTVFSFHPVKSITTAEGGMVLSNRADLAARLRELRSHGITRDPMRFGGDSPGDWYYQQLDLGYNYRLSDIQSALGISQLARLDQFVARRTALARRYDAALENLPVRLPWQDLNTASAWHLYVVRLQLDRIETSRAEVFAALRQAGVGVNVHYIPVHTQPYYRRLGFGSGDFPVAEAYYEEALTLPLYPGLTEAEQDVVIARLGAALYLNTEPLSAIESTEGGTL